jgi:hypothetical protein
MKIIKKKHGPEWFIQKALIEYLQVRGWYVKVMHGNAFQSGVPDLYVNHPQKGPRWIDCKTPKNYTFTKAQRREWPIMDHFGIGIWILTAANQEQYDKLFALPNWKDYWKASWAMPTIADIDVMLQEMWDEEEEEDAATET